MFAEFFYNAQGADYNVDPEFARLDAAGLQRLRLKSSVYLHAADCAYTPTQWQLNQLPQACHHTLQVIFDGIDTAVAAPAPEAFVHLQRDNLQLSAGDEVLLFGAGDAGEPTAQDWAEAAETINYEIVTRLGARVPRVYLNAPQPEFAS